MEARFPLEPLKPITNRPLLPAELLAYPKPELVLTASYPTEWDIPPKPAASTPALVPSTDNLFLTEDLLLLTNLPALPVELLALLKPELVPMEFYLAVIPNPLVL